MSQVNKLIEGMNTIRRKEQGQSSPNRTSVSSIGEMSKIPGFKVKQRKSNDRGKN